LRRALKQASEPTRSCRPATSWRKRPARRCCPTRIALPPTGRSSIANRPGRFTDTLGNAEWWFLPLAGDKAAPACSACASPLAPAASAPEQRRLVEAMADDIAQAMLRTRLVSDLEDARVTGETERLRSALLSSVSHDLRSPLAAIVGAAETLDTYGRGMGEDDRHSLLDTVRLEGERLDRYIQNLLDMTRLGHGGLTSIATGSASTN
jgi:two-component system sensor histidine kinase KdpD